MSTSDGSEPDELAAGMSRLEAALERIASLSVQTASRAHQIASSAMPSGGNGEAGVDTDAVVERLDTMIARLRAVVDEA
jgi:hypothetical protein